MWELEEREQHLKSELCKSLLRHAIMALAEVYLTLYRQRPCDINEGNCEMFTEEVREFLSFPRKVWDDELLGIGECGSHCFLECDGLYYDAECPDGVTDWRQLPFFVRYPNPNAKTKDILK